MIMKSSPINYSPEMILARKAGRKTQTRRVMKHQPVAGSHSLVPHPSHPAQP